MYSAATYMTMYIAKEGRIEQHEMMSSVIEVPLSLLLKQRLRFSHSPPCATVVSVQYSILMHHPSKICWQLYYNDIMHVED